MAALAFPFRVDRVGAIASVDSLVDEVAQEIEVFLTTIIGERVMRAGYGTPLYNIVLEERSAPITETVTILTQMIPKFVPRVSDVNVASQKIDNTVYLTVQFRVVEIVNSPVYTAVINLESQSLQEQVA